MRKSVCPFPSFCENANLVLQSSNSCRFHAVKFVLEKGTEQCLPASSSLHGLCSSYRYNGCRDDVVGIATGLRDKRPTNHGLTPDRPTDFSRCLSRLTSPLVQAASYSIPGTLLPGLQQSGLETNHFPSSNGRPINKAMIVWAPLTTQLS